MWEQVLHRLGLLIAKTLWIDNVSNFSKWKFMCIMTFDVVYLRW